MHSESPLLLEIENPIRHIGSWINPVMKDSEKVKPVLPRASRTCTKLVCPISESRSFVTCSTAGDDIWRGKNLFSFGWIWIKFCRSDTIHPAVFPGKPGFGEGFSLLKSSVNMKYTAPTSFRRQHAWIKKHTIQSKNIC